MEAGPLNLAEDYLAPFRVISRVAFLLSLIRLSITAHSLSTTTQPLRCAKKSTQVNNDLPCVNHNHVYVGIITCEYYVQSDAAFSIES
jgi:hypothetical protein